MECRNDICCETLCIFFPTVQHFQPQDTERQDEYGHLGVCQTKRRFTAEVEAKNLWGMGWSIVLISESWDWVRFVEVFNMN